MWAVQVDEAAFDDLSDLDAPTGKPVSYHYTLIGDEKLASSVLIACPEQATVRTDSLLECALLLRCHRARLPTYVLQSDGRMFGNSRDGFTCTSLPPKSDLLDLEHALDWHPRGTCDFSGTSGD